MNFTMGTVHLMFGGTLLLMFGINLLTLPGSESASFFDRVVESEPATKVKSVIGQFLPRPQKDKPQPDQQSTETPSTTAASANFEPGSVLKRVIGHILPHQHGDAKPSLTNASASDASSTTTSTTTTTTTTTTTAAPKQSAPLGSEIDGTNETLEEGGSATVPPFVETCYLVKKENGTVINTVNMTRAQAGNDTYADYEEVCDADEVNTRISPGALASLAGKNETFEVESSTMPTVEETCYLQKNDSGVILTINKSRAAVGNDTYPDYEEICDEDEVLEPLSISAGALASLAG